MVSVAASGSTSWVCDPSLGSYALEQTEMLRILIIVGNVVHSVCTKCLLHTGRKRKIISLYLCVKDSSSSGVRTLDILPLPNNFLLGVLIILQRVEGLNPNSKAAALADFPL